MSIVTTSPTLSYISSQDSSITLAGSTNYTILFDSSNVSLGNVIMFEYKLQTVSSTIPDLENTSFGFVAIENAIQSGISNQYIISVPAQVNTIDGIPTETIQVRIYFGDNASTDVVVTDWSNELDVYVPPTTPVIYTHAPTSFGGAFYDISLNTLNVLLEESANEYDYNNINFIVCFFYQNSSNNTLWKVSDPTQATSTIIGVEPFRLITVPLEGTVSTDPNYAKVYVSIHAVYDWQPTYYSNLYHSVSFISNEVVAVEASSDSDPNITSVVYNVYNDVSVPGNQTMTVTWEAPGNSGLPFYQVAYYELYYSVNGGAFFLYQNNIPESTLEYTVDVGETGSNPLGLHCGDSIVFRVNAIDVQGTNTPSPDSSSTNIFKYSQAVTNLVITDVTYASISGSNVVGLTVNFDGVSDSGTPNKGCGTGLQYVVEINGSVYSGTGTLVYTSGAAYSIEYSGLNIPQNGDVVVYLQTQNTNASPASPLNGVSNSVPYIAETLVLQPVDYQVYVNQLNTYQDMDLTWNSIVIPDWNVVNYTVQYSTDNGSSWTDATFTSATTYSFDATSFAVSNPPTNITFRVLATVSNGSTIYVITSNEESQYTFKYAETPQGAIVNWSIASTNNTTMDVNVEFTNPAFLGVNDGMQDFIVQVFDASDNAISNLQTVNYDATQILYLVNFNNITYASTGYVKIEPYVLDSNSGSSLTSPYYAAKPNYITSTVPLFQNVVFDFSAGIITGDILSFDILAPVGVVTYPDPVNLYAPLLTKDYSTLGGTDGFTITYTILSNGEFKYSFIIDIQVFTGFDVNEPPPSGAISASNTAGIGAYVIGLITPPTL